MHKLLRLLARGACAMMRRLRRGADHELALAPARGVTRWPLSTPIGRERIGDDGDGNQDRGAGSGVRLFTEVPLTSVNTMLPEKLRVGTARLTRLIFTSVDSQADAFSRARLPRRHSCDPVPHSATIGIVESGDPMSVNDYPRRSGVRPGTLAGQDSPRTSPLLTSSARSKAIPRNLFLGW